MKSRRSATFLPEKKPKRETSRPSTPSPIPVEITQSEPPKKKRKIENLPVAPGSNADVVMEGIRPRHSVQKAHDSMTTTLAPQQELMRRASRHEVLTGKDTTVSVGDGFDENIGVLLPQKSSRVTVGMDEDRTDIKEVARRPDPKKAQTLKRSPIEDNFKVDYDDNMEPQVKGVKTRDGVSQHVSLHKKPRVDASYAMSEMSAGQVGTKSAHFPADLDAPLPNLPNARELKEQQAVSRDLSGDETEWTESPRRGAKMTTEKSAASQQLDDENINSRILLEHFEGISNEAVKGQGMYLHFDRARNCFRISRQKDQDLQIPFASFNKSTLDISNPEAVWCLIEGPKVTVAYHNRGEPYWAALKFKHAEGLQQFGRQISLCSVRSVVQRTE
jgi:hypothetical protein